MHDESPSRDSITRRATTLLLVAVTGVAVVGFLVGIDYGVPHHDPGIPAAAAASDHGGVVLPATNYARLPDALVGPTRRWPHELDRLRTPTPDLFAEIVPDPEAKLASLRQRSERRAYNGAPPVVPHTVDQLGQDTCLACHGPGLRIENRTARSLPHPYLANCLQCHAPATPAEFASVPLAGNGFDGVAAPTEGARAWLGAPPVVPHTTWMRNDCLACHGPNGWPGMETTHPWRQNCLQCHAPSSALDLNPSTLTAVEFLPPPDVVEP